MGATEAPPRDWPALLLLAGQALAIWDAWCPDDGRPARGVQLLAQYVAGAMGARALLDAAQPVAEACGMACDSVWSAIPTDTPRGRAWWAGSLILALMQLPSAPKDRWYVRMYATHLGLWSEGEPSDVAEGA